MTGTSSPVAAVWCKSGARTPPNHLEVPLLKRLLIAPFAAIAAVIAMAVPANAATASSTEFHGTGWTALIGDDVAGGTVLRIPEYFASNGSYVYTYVLQGVLNNKPNQNIQVCAKYRTNTNGFAAAPTVSNGVWSVTFPASWGKSWYQDQCVTVKNSGSQPYGSVSVAVYGTDTVLLKNVRIN
jgi:hypothetical protein